VDEAIADTEWYKKFTDVDIPGKLNTDDDKEVQLLPPLLVFNTQPPVPTTIATLVLKLDMPLRFDVVPLLANVQEVPPFIETKIVPRLPTAITVKPSIVDTAFSC
jgi:hypothetical protein